MKKRLIFLSIFTLFILACAYMVKARKPLVMVSPKENLKAFSYLTWVQEERAPDKQGVTIYDRERSFAGVNVFNSQDAAYLMDGSGSILHTWFRKAPYSKWAHVELCPDGDLLVMRDDRTLSRLDWYSNIKWTRPEVFVHHDFDIATSGDIYTIARKLEIVFLHGLPVPISNDYIMILSADGRIKSEIAIFEAVKGHMRVRKAIKMFIRACRRFLTPRNLLKMVQRGIRGKGVFLFFWFEDVIHANAVEVVDRSIEGVCDKGDVLTCVRQMDLVGVMDIEKGRFVWEWKGRTLINPHKPTFLENGNILVFDNGGRHRKYSRVVEIDPRRMRIVWEHKADPPEDLFTSWAGAAQRFPNGNTLITESSKGRAFEITPEGEVVWEFYNTVTRRDKRAALYRILRIANPEDFPCLDKLR